MPKAITTQLKNLKQLDSQKVLRLYVITAQKFASTIKLEMCQAQSLRLCCAFFSPRKGTGFFLF